MAICEFCKKDMLKTDNCEYAQKNKIKIYGKEYQRLTLHFNEQNGHCHDCGVKHGNYHHPGCDVERCPHCMRQLLTCDCRNSMQE